MSAVDEEQSFFYPHPHTEKIGDKFDFETDSVPPDTPVIETARRSRKSELKRQQRLESLSEEVDSAIYDELGISGSTREEITTEIFLRTSEDPEDRQIPDPESVPEVPDNLDEQVKDLVHHFAMEAVREEPDHAPLERRMLEDARETLGTAEREGRDAVPDRDLVEASVVRWVLADRVDAATPGG